ncbi:Protein ENL [Camponotus floridanus]|uniref:Protein ENL n=1 Tax=Camponotus floridanus TaxID=104421 RepID=E2A6N2_CAMFO|nr:protein AF-9 [Camponotus floridanus]EFN70907.1 Protein ENL [Camponotus floridanus]
MGEKIRITLECGHTSVLRVHSTPEGYTHDWEVFVRGVDNADIHHYIEKVVFILHNTFRNPKRVLKEPPFVVKESGYAGFIIPIEVYLKNKDEPKKVCMQYDLVLQHTAAPYNNAILHSEVILNPSDEFKKKLLKGGGIIERLPIKDSLVEKSDTKTPTMVSKAKLNGSESKKHRIAESKTSNSFQELFGPPIKTAPLKISPDSKKTSQSDKNSVPKPLAISEKSDKLDKTIKKESPHKDKKDKVDEKKDKKGRDSSKDRLKNKEKSKRPPSPGSKSHSSPGNKKSTSPVVTKKPLSPLPSSTKRSVSPKSKERDVKKILPDKEKDKAKSNSRSDIDSSKSEKKKDKKKHKDDKDRDKKDKYKEAEKVKDVMKMTEKKSEKADKTEKTEKEKSQEYKSSRDGRKSPKSTKENDRVKDDKAIKEKSEKSEKSEKTRDGKSDKDRQKHKHKKRDKKDKRDSKDREKKDKRERSKDGSEKQNNTSSASVGNSSLLTEVPERDSSDSAPSVDDDSLLESKPVLGIKKETEHAIISTPTETAKPLSPDISVDVKKEKSDRSRKDKSKGSRSEERENRKRKRSKEDDEIPAKREKARGHSTSPPLEPVSSSQSPVAMDVDSVHHSEKEAKKEFKKEKDDRVNSVDQVTNDKDMEIDAEQVAPDSTNSTDAEISEPPVFSEDYVSQLKDLQQKIMTLQDNEELQRVVQVIAETGQYEITKKTFDFDLCALDRRTVQRLQEFFSAS